MTHLMFQKNRTVTTYYYRNVRRKSSKKEKI